MKNIYPKTNYKIAENIYIGLTPNAITQSLSSELEKLKVSAEVLYLQNLIEDKTSPIRWVVTVGNPIFIEDKQLILKGVAEKYIANWLPDNFNSKLATKYFEYSSEGKQYPFKFDTLPMDSLGATQSLAKLVTVAQSDAICIQGSFEKDNEITLTLCKTILSIILIHRLLRIEKFFVPREDKKIMREIIGILDSSEFQNLPKNIFDQFTNVVYKRDYRLLCDSIKDIYYHIIGGDEYTGQPLYALNKQVLDLFSRLPQKHAIFVKDIDTLSKTIKDNFSKYIEKRNQTSQNTKKISPQIKVTVLQNALDRLLKILSRERNLLTVGDLLQTKLILTSVKNQIWMYEQRDKASFNSAGPESIRDTILSPLQKIDEILLALCLPAHNRYIPVNNFYIPHFSEEELRELQEKQIESINKESKVSVKEKVIMKMRFEINKMKLKDSDFIFPNIVLGRKPKKNKAQEIINKFEPDSHLALVIAILTDSEAATTVQPETWHENHVEYMLIRVKDNTTDFYLVRNQTFKALNKLFLYLYSEDYSERKLGAYVHCASGKGRSVAFLAAFIALFCTDKSTSISSRVSSAFALIKSIRKRADNLPEKRRDVEQLVKEYLLEREPLIINDISTLDDSNVSLTTTEYQTSQPQLTYEANESVDTTLSSEKFNVIAADEVASQEQNQATAINYALQQTFMPPPREILSPIEAFEESLNSVLNQSGSSPKTQTEAQEEKKEPSDIDYDQLMGHKG